MTTLALSFLIGSLFLQVIRTIITSWLGSKFRQDPTWDVWVSCPWASGKIPTPCDHSCASFFHLIFFILVGYQDMINRLGKSLKATIIDSFSYNHRHLGSVEKNKPPPPNLHPSLTFAFFHLKYDILYAWSYTGVRKNDLEHMENIWKKMHIAHDDRKKHKINNFGFAISNPHRRQKCNALVILNKHTKLFHRSILYTFIYFPI